MAIQPEIVGQLFEVALALKPAERGAFLDQACSHDPELRRTVEELLAEDANAGSLLEHPPFDFLGAALVHPPRSSGTTAPVDENEIASRSPAGRLQPGQVLIDRFAIVRFIAKGGMGEVYEAEDRFLQGVHVAVKTILPQIADEPALRQRFEREVLLAREVSHPNLCPIYDIFRCEQPPNNFLFLTMKLLPGETLSARLRGTASMSIAEGLAILKQMAAGLAAIHAAGIIHRDIKPNNVMLDGTGAEVRVCITDFGLARDHEADPSLSGKGLVAGTPDYMAPELYQGRPPSQASDLFALGVVLHEIFTGQKPVVAPDGSSVIVSQRLNTSGVPSYCTQLIVGCLDQDPARRYEAFDRILDSLQIKYRSKQLWTRRRFAGAATAAIAAMAGAAWWKWDEMEDLLRPLPRKRFVALLNWPKTSDIHITPMLTSVLGAIKTELTHFETLDQNLFVISPEDVGSSIGNAAAGLKDVCDPLGANLVLAASGSPGDKHFQLFLRVLDPSSGQPLREKRLTCTLTQITSLPQKAVHAVASLLDLENYSQDDKQAEPETHSAAAFTAFQSAETLKNQPNDSRLDAAIEQYKQAIDLDPRYAVAHARLALAYTRLYAIRRIPEALDLAYRNCQVALSLNPGLAETHLALAWVFQETGNNQGALNEIDRALSLDPSSRQALVWQAQIYARLNRWEDAEKTFHRALKEHPNYWLAYNELGFGLHGQARYREAIQAFRAASLAAPKNALTLANLGAEYLQVGEFAEGLRSSQQSLALEPASDLAAANISLAYRYQGKYEKALPFARKAVQLNPALDSNWLELGDCQASFPNHQSEAKAAYSRAAKEAESHLLTDPADAPSWMLLALYKVKVGSPQNAPLLIERAESLGARDMDSQIYKARILELLGKREDALTTLAACFRKGATDLQLVEFPDLQPLRKDPRYHQLAQSKALATVANASPGGVNL
jgi:tetratricopeptide (TPR) repeat protein/tRNA A-37 threonylcarbamoyl transferase component Bud32